MNRHRAFTIIELLVVIAIIAVLIGLLFPAIGAIKRNARRKESDVRVRNIMQSMITYSEARRGFFPGFDGFTFTADGLETTGNCGPGQYVQARYWILLDGNYTDPTGLVSPAEGKNPWPNEQYPDTNPDRFKVLVENYSFSLLRLAVNNNVNPSSSPDDAYRRSEWRNQQNPQAPLVTDRLGVDGTPGTPDTYVSIHDSSEPGEWLGSIGFGDLSVKFSDTAIIPTRYDNQRNEEDDLFVANDGDGGSTAEDQKKSAMMVYRDADEVTE